MAIAVVGAGGTGGYFGGRRLELESLKGEVVRRGREHGVSETPLNFAICAALRPYVDGAPPSP